MPPTAQKIDQLQVTRDTLTSRGGLTFLVKYVETIGILAHVAVVVEGFLAPGWGHC
jgi:hypothetical protein